MWRDNELPAVVVFFLHPNNAHDIIDQWLILINDSSKTVKERHGCPALQTSNPEGSVKHSAIRSK